MNPKTFLSKTTSVVASLVLAIGGSLIATQPASAAPANTVAPAISGNATVGSTLTTNSGTWNESSTMVMYRWYRCDASITARQRIGGPSGDPSGCAAIASAFTGSYTLVSADLGKHIASLVTWQASSGSTDWFSASVGAVANASNPTCVVNGVTTTAVTAAASTVTNLASGSVFRYYFNGDNTLNGCEIPMTSMAYIDTLNGTQIGSTYYAGSATGLLTSTNTRTYLQLVTGSTFNGVTVADGDVYVRRYFFNVGSSPTMSTTGYFAITMTLYPSGTVPQNNSQNQNNVTATVERYVPPTPAFQAPILNSLAPKLTSGFSSNGGKLVLKDVKPSDITSVTLNGKPVTIVESKSGSALKIPAGSAAGDLKFTMADGTVIDVPNAVKITQSQVDPRLVDLNNLPTFKAGSVAVPKTITAALNKNKAIILDSVNAKCVGYATSNTASARATALTRASNVCGVITDINESIDPIIKVVVNKIVAKKSPVKYQTW